MAADESEGRRSLLERVLSVVTEVKAGEGITALLLTINVFLLLTAYYLIKPVREALILALKGGAEYKSYLGAAIALALLVAVPLYARAANKLARNRLVIGVTLFFISNLLLFYVLRFVPFIEQYLGLIFFVWVGIFNMMVVAQFWAFANDMYTEEQGKRLFALVGLGASIGAATGSWVAGQFSAEEGPFFLLLLSSGILGGCAFLTQVVHLRESRSSGRDGTPPKEDGKDKPARPKGAYALVFRNRYLLLIALFSLLFTFVNTNGEYILGSLIADRASEAVAAARLGKEGDIEYLEDARIAVRVESSRYAVQKHFQPEGLATEIVPGEVDDRIEVTKADGTEIGVVALSFRETAAFVKRVEVLQAEGVKTFLVDQDLFEMLEKEGELARLEARGIEVIRAAYTYRAWKKAVVKNVISGAFGRFFFYVNVLGVLFQMFAVSRIIKYAGFGPAFFIFPVIALADAVAFAAVPRLSVIRFGKTAENATDYSLNNTLRQMLWLPTTREMKYKAKQAVDTFFVRMGDVSSGGLVYAGQTLSWTVRAFAFANVVLVGIWLFLAVGILRERKRLTAEAPSEDSPSD